MVGKFYGKSKRQFIKPEEISRHLFCSICQEVFEQPTRLSCGHTFCYLCIQTWCMECRINKLCPICKKDLSKRILEKDLIASQIIDDLPVKCVHKGCQWMGIHAIVKRHQRQCNFRVKKISQQEQSKIHIVEVVDLDESQGTIELD